MAIIAINNITLITKATTNTVTYSTSNAAIVGDVFLLGIFTDNLTATTPNLSAVTIAAGSWTTTVLATKVQGASSTLSSGLIGTVVECVVTSPIPAGTLMTITFDQPGAYLAAVVGRQLRNIDPLSRVITTPTSGVASAPSITTGSIATGRIVVAMGAIEANVGAGSDSDTLNGSWSGPLGATTTTGSTSIDNIAAVWQTKIVTGTGAQTWNLAATAASVDWIAFAVDYAEATTVTADLYENGLYVATIGTALVGPNTSVLEFDWDATFTLSDLTGAGVELRLSAPTGFDVNAIEWNAAYAPVVSTPATATPAVVVTSVSVGAPVPSAGTTVSSAVVVTAVAVGASTDQTSSTVTASAVVTTTAVGTPVLSTGSVVIATVIALPVVVSSPTISDNEVVVAPTVVTVTAVAAPSELTSSIVTPAATVTVVGVAGASERTGSTNVATVVVTTTAVAAPVLHAGETVVAGVVPVVTAMSAPVLAVTSLVESWGMVLI